MSSPDWASMSELEQLALLCNAPGDENQFMAFINVAFCDESEYHKTPGVYVVSGFLGRGPDWYEFGRKWRVALKKEGLESVGFHMAPCENRKPPYDQMERPERWRLQRIFIGLINAAPIWGMATAIELDRFRAPDIQEPMAQALGIYRKPYYQTFQHTVEWMAEEVERGGFPREERIAFFFDRQREYQGNAKDLYDDMTESEHVVNRHRLGRLSFDDDVQTVQLQAADIWAYEVQRHIRDVKLGGGEVRWQWELLKEAPGLQRQVKVLDFDGAEGFAREQGWIK